MITFFLKLLFKGKFRIREVSNQTTRMRANLTPVKNDLNRNSPMLQMDFNKNPMVLKCRLYVIKSVIYRSWDRSGKADPYIKILLNNDLIVDEVKETHYNTLEPVFGK